MADRRLIRAHRPSISDMAAFNAAGVGILSSMDIWFPADSTAN
jgi:hypothetical protein